MPQFDDKHVKLVGGRIVWDGVTQPEQVTQGSAAGKLKYTLKAVFPPSCNDLGLFDQLANATLQTSQFKGTLPAGGRMPIQQVQAGEFGDLFPGWYCISFKTTLKAPDVYNENGQLLDPMQYGPLVYSGQAVDVLAHCYEYNSAGNKGISAGLDGFAIIASANAQRENFGGSGVNTAGAFGGGQQPQQNAPAQGGGYGQQPQQNAPAQGGGYGQQPQQNAPAQGGGYGQQPQQNAPAQGGGYGQQPQQNAPAQGGGYGQQPQQNAPAQGGGYGQQPQQNTNFMPNQ